MQKISRNAYNIVLFIFNNCFEVVNLVQKLTVQLSLNVNPINTSLHDSTYSVVMISRTSPLIELCWWMSS